MNRSVLKLLLLIAGLVSLTCMAAADSFTFDISGIIPSSGKSVSSVVTITTTGGPNGNGTQSNGFDIKIVNTTANPSDITQILDGIKFNLLSGVTLNGLKMQDGTYHDKNNVTQNYTSAIVRTINPGGSFSDVTSNKLGSSSGQIDWGLVNGQAFEICAGAISHNGSCALHPNGVIGDPNTSNNYYSAANSSITNGQHTPELYGTLGKPVTFHVYASNITANTLVADVIGSANFYYGTGGGKDKITSCIGSCGGGGGGGNVPEPSSMVLLGTGLAGAVARLRRRK